jgi:hypothetical protein
VLEASTDVQHSDRSRRRSERAARRRAAPQRAATSSVSAKPAYDSPCRRADAQRIEPPSRSGSVSDGRITAERLVEHLERSGYVVMHEPPLGQHGAPGNLAGWIETAAKMDQGEELGAVAGRALALAPRGVLAHRQPGAASQACTRAILRLEQARL